MGPIDFLNGDLQAAGRPSRRSYRLYRQATGSRGQRMPRVARCDRRALAVDGPAIVDCIVAPDELPNMPHIDLGLAKNYAIAKIKEAVIA